MANDVKVKGVGIRAFFKLLLESDEIQQEEQSEVMSAEWEAVNDRIDKKEKKVREGEKVPSRKARKMNEVTVEETPTAQQTKENQSKQQVSADKEIDK